MYPPINQICFWIQFPRKIPWEVGSQFPGQIFLTLYHNFLSALADFIQHSSDCWLHVLSLFQHFFFQVTWFIYLFFSRTDLIYLILELRNISWCIFASQIIGLWRTGSYKPRRGYRWCWGWSSKRKMEAGGSAFLQFPYYFI